MSKGSSNACSLHNYFENSSKHSKFNEIVKDLCVGYIFSPKKSPGITVLAPSAKLLKKIEDLYNSNDYSNVVKAREIVKSLVLKADIKTMDDWLRYADDVPNWLNQKVPINADGGKVLVNGQSVTLDKDFNDMSERRNLSVWMLDGEEGVGVKNPESKAKFSKTTKKGKAGGYEYTYEGGAGVAEGLRGKIATVVENVAAGGSGEQAFIAYAADLLKYMQKNKKEYEEKLLPNVTLDSMADFYILLDPHKMASEPLINDISIKGWWASAQKKDVVAAGSAMVGSIKSDLDSLAAKTKIGEVVDTARIDIESSGNILRAVNRAYSQLSSNNSVDGGEQIYPSAFAKYMKENPEWKMLSDQLKFGIALKSAQLDEDGASVGEKVETLANMIEDYMTNKGRGVVRFCGLPLCRWGNLVGKDEEAHLFVNTDYFLSNSSRAPQSLSGNAEAKKLLGGDGAPSDIANVHQYLCDKNVRTMGAKASEARERLENTLKELKGFAGNAAGQMGLSE